MTLMTRSRTSAIKDDGPAGGVEAVEGRLLCPPETHFPNQHTIDTSSSRNPLRRSDTTNIPNAEYDIALPRLPGKVTKPRRNARTDPHVTTTSKQPAIYTGDALSDQRRRIKTWKDIARKKETRDKQATTEQQRLVMLMVFNEITPYPPEDWVSLIGGLINRSTAQVDTFFSNTRQKFRRDLLNAGDNSAPDHVRACRGVDVGKDRPVKMRRSALELCASEMWTDAFIEEIVMIYNFRALGYLRQRGRTTSSRHPECC